MTRQWTEEQVAALVDGSLDDEGEAARLRRVLETDPDARAFADDIERSNRLVRKAFEAPENEPIPAGIQAAIFAEPGKVATLRPQHRFTTWISTATAAGIALAIGLGAGVVLDGPEKRVIVALGDAPEGGALHHALDTLPSGAISDDGVQPMLSFYDGAGRPCREFEVIGELPQELEFGIACRTATDGWHVEIVVAAPITEPGSMGYSPASGPAARALDAMLDALDAGPALAPEDEASLISRGWRRAH